MLILNSQIEIIKYKAKGSSIYNYPLKLTYNIEGSANTTVVFNNSNQISLFLYSDKLI